MSDVNEWAEELAELAREHHGRPDIPFRPMVVLTREQMAAGERAHGAPPRLGDVRAAGPDRWIRYNGESWEPFTENEPILILDDVSLENVKFEFTPAMEEKFAEVLESFERLSSRVISVSATFVDDDFIGQLMKLADEEPVDE